MDGLVQDFINSIANALEFWQSWSDNMFTEIRITSTSQYFCHNLRCFHASARNLSNDNKDVTLINLMLFQSEDIYTLSMLVITHQHNQ